MIPTVEEVVEEMQSLLGDDEARVFGEALCLKGYKSAYRYLRSAMTRNQISRAKAVATYILPTGTPSLDPETAGITDFGELIEMGERRPGTSEEYTPLTEVESIGVRTAGASLNFYEWRGDEWHFYTATQGRELKISYYSSGTPPESGSVGIDDSLEFLATYGAAKVGPRRGYDDAEIQRMRKESLGPDLDGNGGLIFDLIQPMVRSLQRIQRQPKPYTAGVYGWKRFRPAPYIAAPPATEGVMQVLTITGTQDGENDTFSLSSYPQSLQIFNNGILQYPDVAYTLDGTIVTFLPDYIPQSTDLLRAEAVV